MKEPRGNNAQAAAPEACEAGGAKQLQFSNDGSLAALVLQDRVDVYPTSDWKRSATIGRERGLESMTLTPDGRYLFLAIQADGESRTSLSLSETKTGQTIWRGATALPPLTGMAVVVAPDSSWFAFAEITEVDQPPVVELLSLPGLDELGKFAVPGRIERLRRPTWHPRALPPPKPARGMPGMSFSVPNGPPDWGHDVVTRDPAASVERLSVGADSKHLLIGWSDGSTSLIDARGAKEVAGLVGFGGEFSPSGRFIALGRVSGAIALYDTEKRRGTLFYDPLCQANPYQSFSSFSPDERLVALAGSSFRVCLAETTSAKGKGLVPPQVPTQGAFEDEGFAQPGAWVSDGSGLLVSPGMGKPLGLYALGTSKFTQLSRELKADDPRVDNASAGVIRRMKDQSLVVFNSGGRPGVEIVGLQVHPLARGSSDFSLAAASPDGEVYARQEAGAVVVKSTRGGGVITTLEGAGSPAFDPSGRFLHTTGPAGVRVWNARSGERLFTLRACSSNPT
ncbi:MAG: hypothetical protein KC766_03325 [Myxococcales bacterium]|nr:hypothetical protein [Myxococcales bacterium]